MAGKTVEKAIELEQSRKQFFEESKFVPDNQKYGLFSFPGTLAISKNSYYQDKPTKKNKDGTVDLEPKNFISGKSPKKYFSSPEYKPDKYNSNVSSYSTEKERAMIMKQKHDLS